MTGKILIFASILNLSQLVTGIKTLDVEPYINQIEERLENISKPSPEVVEAFVQELQATCKTNRTIDLNMMYNMSSCMEDLFNQTSLVTEFKDAIPKGDLDVVFRGLCLKWPEMKSCMQEGLQVINECWGQGAENQLLKGMDAFVGFFCGADNDGARVALFIAEDGMACLETYGKLIGECMTDLASENSAHNLCIVIEHLNQCVSILKKCTNVTPENLVSSLVRYIGKVIECPPLQKPTYVYADNSEPSVFDSIQRILTSFTKLLDNHAYLRKFSTGLQKLAEECDRKGVEFNFKKLQDGTRNCSSLTIPEPKYTDFTWRRSRMSSTCSTVMQSSLCLAPYRDLLQNCSADAFIALTLADELCQNNASFIQEAMSLNQHELQCFQRRLTWSTFRKCGSMVNVGNQSAWLIHEDSQHDFCGTLSLVKTCGLLALSKCRNPKPMVLANRFLNAVEARDALVQECFSVKNSRTSDSSGLFASSIGHNYSQFASRLILIFCLRLISL